jgi:hypothetical protein
MSFTIVFGSFDRALISFEDVFRSFHRTLISFASALRSFHRTLISFASALRSLPRTIFPSKWTFRSSHFVFDPRPRKFPSCPGYLPRHLPNVDRTDSKLESGDRNFVPKHTSFPTKDKKLVAKDVSSFAKDV